MGTMIIILIIAVVSMLVLQSAVWGYQNLLGDEKFAASQNSREQLQQSLDIVLSSSPICQAVLRLNGSNFNFQNLLNPQTDVGTGPGRLAIGALHLQNTQSLPGGYVRALFSADVRMTSGGTAIRAPASQVIYHPSGLGADDCRLESSAQDACAAYGFQWNAGQSRCEICESLGGTWGGTRCQL